MAYPSSVTVPIRFVHELVSALDAQKTRQTLVEKSGISWSLLQEKSARVTTEQYAILYRLVARELDDELPGLFSRPARGGALKMLCLSMLDAANLKVALYRLSRFLRLILDDVRVEVSQKDGRVCVALVPVGSGAPLRMFSQEMLLKVIHGLLSWLAGRRVPLAWVDFAYPLPGHASAYAYLYPGPACFDQARTAFHFEAGELESPVRQSKRALAEFLGRAPADWLFVPFAEGVVSHRVREYLEKHLDQRTTIVQAAKALHFSVRTLSRRLDIEGTSFQAVKDELRRDLAIQSLTRTDLPISVIGAEIGFDDPTTFYRAFKKWTGSTPGAYRLKR